MLLKNNKSFYEDVGTSLPGTWMSLLCVCVPIFPFTSVKLNDFGRIGDNYAMLGALAES